jgi:hypothetical protein
MDYEWKPSQGIADFVLREVVVEEGDTTPADTLRGVYAPPRGFIMKSGPTSYTAWVPNDAGNRMEFFDVETAKAWVFTQVRMNDGAALIRTDSLR